MRVLSVSTLFPSPARPAFGKFVSSQMQAVATRGDVDLVLLNPLGMPPWPLSRREPYRGLAGNPQRSELNGIPVHHPRFTTIPLIGGDGNAARMARAILPLVRELHAERRFDLVDAQFFFPDGPTAAILARALELPLTIKARGSDVHYWGSRPAALAAMRDAASQSACLLAVSEALRRDMIGLGMPGDRIVVHYTGLDHRRFRPIPREEARTRIAELAGLHEEERLLVTPGALIPIKGQRIALAALAQLPGARLALAGTGADETELRSLAANLGVAERVSFLGQVSHDLLPTLLSAADAVVLPSEREGLANAWIEALACGTPLVIPDVGGAAEIVRDATAGRLVERTPQAIAAAVCDLLIALPDQQAVAANAARFSWEANAAGLVELWRRAAGTA
ncbi:MAG TPA: glycosyltransferase [Novosphingobium sp.]